MANDVGTKVGADFSRLAIMQSVFDADENALIVGSIQKKWRDDFIGAALDTTKWTLVQQDAGTALSVAGSVLTLGAGTTNGSSVIVQSVASFTIPFRVQVLMSLSQRILNQDFVVEIRNAAGTSAARWRFNGTNAVQSATETQDAGSNMNGPTTRTILTTASNQLVEIDLYPDECWFRSRNADSTTGIGTNAEWVHHKRLPDPDDGPYFIRLYWTNTGVPGSNTNALIESVTVMDINELTAEVTGGRGGQSAAQAVPVAATIVGGSISSLSSATQGSSAGTVGTWNRRGYFSESTTPLAGGATFTGTGRDSLASAAGGGAVNGFGLFRATASADVNGTLFVDESDDNATWYESPDSVAVVGSGASPQKFFQVEHKMTMRYARVRYVNGAGAQANFRCMSCLVAMA